MSELKGPIELPKIPGFQESGLTTLYSRTTHHILHVEPGTKGTEYRLARLNSSGDLEPVVSSSDLEEVERIYAEDWLRQIAVDIGIGFHPDTSADQYSPPLPDPLALDYDAVIGLAFDRGIDPYEVGMDAWRKAGIMESEPPSP